MDSNKKRFHMCSFVALATLFLLLIIAVLYRDRFVAKEQFVESELAIILWKRNLSGAGNANLSEEKECSGSKSLPAETNVLNTTIETTKEVVNPYHKTVKKIVFVPASLGMELDGGKMYIFIDRYTKIPTMVTRQFGTKYEESERTPIRIFEGESPLAKNNKLLDEFAIEQLSDAGATISVTFFINADRVLKVSATEISTGKTNGITVPSYKDRQFLERSIAYVEKLGRADDRDEKEWNLASASTVDLETYCSYIEETLDENKDVVTEEDKKRMQEKCANAIEWMNIEPSIKIEDFEKRLNEIKEYYEQIMTF